MVKGEKEGAMAISRVLERMSGISSEVLCVSLGVCLPVRGLVIHRVLQAVPVFVIGGVSHVSQSQGHPFSCKYLRVGKCPFSAAEVHVYSSQGHPFSCRYWRAGRCPFSAAEKHVYSSQGHPFSCKYWRAGKCPFRAA